MGAIATLLSILWWLNIVSFVRIGIVYPLIQAGAILLTLILSSFLLKENISFSQFLGIFIIVFGIIIISK